MIAYPFHRSSGEIHIAVIGTAWRRHTHSANHSRLRTFVAIACAFSPTTTALLILAIAREARLVAHIDAKTL
jgi:hypothetical protein